MSATTEPRAKSPIPWDSREALVGGAVALALCWRLWLMTRFAGWEESDYGNLAMIRGVLDGGFLHYDMSHMPGYYGLSALALVVVGDTVVAARLVTLLGGLLALGGAVWMADRMGGRRVARVTAIVLILQPEFALYSSSSLREPVYVAFVVGALMALARERLTLAGCLVSAAFLVRFDGALSLGPALAIHALGRPPRAQRLAHAFLPLALVMAAWSIYCRIDHGTFVFFGHAVQVNLDTGLGGESAEDQGWLYGGLRVMVALVAGLLPSRIGWFIWGGLLIALWYVPWRRHDARRTWALAGLGLLGVWAGMGLVAQHSPEHNLYWKWMLPLVPVLVPIGAAGLLGVAERIGQRIAPFLGRMLVAAALLQATVAALLETERQVARSRELYLPQLELARWVEATVPEEVPMLLDNIPACWIDRRPHSRRLTSWFDVPVPPGDEAAFARWLGTEQVQWVLWFREDWTQAPVVAPFLKDGGVWTADGVRLEERRREDLYGWIFYQVVAPGAVEATPALDPARGGK